MGSEEGKNREVTFYHSELFRQIGNLLRAKCERLEWYGDDEDFCPPYSLFLECSYVSKQKYGYLHINVYEHEERPTWAYEYQSHDETCKLNHSSHFTDLEDFREQYLKEVECVFSFVLRPEPKYEQMKLF